MLVRVEVLDAALKTPADKEEELLVLDETEVLLVEAGLPEVPVEEAPLLELEKVATLVRELPEEEAEAVETTVEVEVE